MMRKLVEKVLTSDGFQVVLAEDGEVRLHHGEQQRHHREHAVEVTGPRGAFEERRQAPGLDLCVEARRVDLVPHLRDLGPLRRRQDHHLAGAEPGP